MHKFFQKELKQINEIIRMFAGHPEILSTLMLLYEDKKRFNFTDFTLNISNLLFSYYYLEEYRTLVIIQPMRHQNSMCLLWL
jgi:hypothetical protein